MTISLRKAAQLQTAITQAASELSLSTSDSLPIFDANLLERITAAETKLKQDLHLQCALRAIVYDIRKQVAKVNASVGITDVLADLARVTQDINAWSNVVNTTTRESDATLKARLKAIEKNNAKAETLTEDIYLRFVSEEWQAEAKTKVLALKRERQRLQDKLAELNLKHSISLDKASTELLESQGLL